MHNAIGGMEYMTHPLTVLSIISFQNDIRCYTEAKGDVGNNNVTMKQSNLLNSIWSLITLSRWLDKVITTRRFQVSVIQPSPKKNRWTNLLLFFWRSSTPLYFCIRMDFLHKFERNKIQKWHSMKPQAREKYFNLSYTFNYFNIFPQYWTSNRSERIISCPFENAWHYCSYLALVTFCENRQPKPPKRGLLPQKESILQGTNISPSNGSQRASTAWCRE